MNATSVVALCLMAGLGVIAVVGYCITHSLVWHSFWRQRAHEVLGASWDWRWSTRRAA